MGTDKEIKLAIDTCKKNNNHKIIILKCTSEYPTKIENCNLSKIDYYKKKFKCLVGISDHTSDYIAPIVGVSKGAVLIEKHFKLSNKIKSTIYKHNDKVLIVIGSWSNKDENIELIIDWKELGIKKEQARLRSPNIDGLQNYNTFEIDKSIPINKNSGLILILD